MPRSGLNILSDMELPDPENLYSVKHKILCMPTKKLILSEPCHIATLKSTKYFILDITIENYKILSNLLINNCITPSDFKLYGASRTSGKVVL
jgi:hypothetical protein